MPAAVAAAGEGDAFGQAMIDRLNGLGSALVVERDDGYVDVDDTDYLGGWPDRDQWALERVAGRVLDVGAGAGRASLAAMRSGHEVTALDTSAGALAVCRQRGVADTFQGTVEELAAAAPGRHDTALLLGNNLGLLRSREDAAAVLAALAAVLSPGGMIIGAGLDPYQTGKPVHLAYHEANRRRGRMPGQLTIRVRYQRLASAWFGWLQLSPGELAELAAPAGWRVADMFPGVLYAARLVRA